MQDFVHQQYESEGHEDPQSSGYMQLELEDFRHVQACKGDDSMKVQWRCCDRTTAYLELKLPMSLHTQTPGT